MEMAPHLDADPSARTRAALALLLAILLVVSLGCASIADRAGASTSTSSGRRARPAEVGLSPEALARLDALLDDYVETGRLAGYQLQVARRGAVVHERVFGSKDREAQEALEVDTIFRIYSMSKVVTGVATMIAWERGGFLLGDPVSKYLPELTDLEVLVVNADGRAKTVPAEREITILDLLRHTSGIPYHFTAPPQLGARYVGQSITPGIRPLPRDTFLGGAGADQSLTLADMVTRIGELPLAAQPGSRWLYGINMDVLGRLIEVTMDMPFPEFLERNLFAPLGMQDTAFHVPDEKIERFAALYEKTAEGEIALVDPPRESSYREPPAMPGGGGGLVSTADDYMRFAQMLLDEGRAGEGRILAPGTVRLMMSNHLPTEEFGPRPLAMVAAPAYANGGLGLGFGLTGSVVVDPALTGLSVSPGTFGWGGAASTFFWVDPQEEIAVVFMTQLLPSSAYPLRGELMRGVHSAILD